MDAEHLPRTCSWAKPTLLLDWPDWLNAWSSEWSCQHDGAYHPLVHSECCRTCPRWQAKADDDLIRMPLTADATPPGLP